MVWLVEHQILKAFGDTEDEFINILRLPHKFIFNRDWYEMYEGRAEYDEFMSEFNKLSEDEINELMTFVSSHKNSEIANNINYLSSTNLKNITHYYKNLSGDESRKIWDKQKTIKANKLNIFMTDDEIVEDAGLDHDPEKETIEEFKKVINR